MNNDDKQIEECYKVWSRDIDDLMGSDGLTDEHLRACVDTLRTRLRVTEESLALCESTLRAENARLRAALDETKLLLEESEDRCVGLAEMDSRHCGEYARVMDERDRVRTALDEALETGHAWDCLAPDHEGNECPCRSCETWRKRIRASAEGGVM